MATASRSGPARRRNGRRSTSTRSPAGSRSTEGCGASSRGTSWGARTHPPAPCTTGTARCARPGTTRSGSPASTRSPRRAKSCHFSNAGATELVEANDALALEIRHEDGGASAAEPGAGRARRQPVCRARVRRRGRPGQGARGDLRKLNRAYAENTASLEAIDLRIQHLREGATDDPKAHIRHANEPTTSRQARFGRAAEVWAGISIGLVLIALVAVVLLAPAEFLPTATFLIGLTLFIDALFRGVAEQFVNTLAVVLAVTTAAILLWSFWQLLLLGLLLVAGIYLTWENLRTVGE